MKTRLTTGVAVILCAAGCAWGGSLTPTKVSGTAAATQPADLPPAINRVRPRLAGKGRDEVLAMLTKEFGPQARDIGSGLSIPQWDMGGGVLQFHPSVGPTFRMKEKTTWLIATHNPAGANIVGNYEMYTLPDPANHGTSFWIGNLKLSAHGTYRYVPGSIEPQAKEARNFFVDHAEGTYKIAYAGVLNKESLLEDQADRATLATVTFTGKAPTDSAKIQLKVDAAARWLDFAAAGDAPMNCVMQKSWLEYWK